MNVYSQKRFIENQLPYQKYLAIFFKLILTILQIFVSISHFQYFLNTN